MRVASIRVSAPSGPRMCPDRDVGERTRAQPVRQRMRRVLLHPCRGKEVRSLALLFRAHPPSVTLICWPPRTTVMRQICDEVFDALSRSPVLAIFWLFTASMISPFWNRRSRPFRRRRDQSRQRPRGGVQISSSATAARCWRLWRPGTASARSARSHRGWCRARSPAAPSASPSCRRAARRSARNLPKGV